MGYFAWTISGYNHDSVSALWHKKPYDSGNTSSMATHLKRHHPGVSLTGVKTKAAQQPLIIAAFKQPLVAQSDRDKAVTHAVGVFKAADMRTDSVVQNEGFFFFFLLIRKMIRSVDSDPRIDPIREFVDPLHPHKIVHRPCWKQFHVRRKANNTKLLTTISVDYLE